MAEESCGTSLDIYCKAGLDRLVVCNALRVHALCNTNDLLRELNLLLLHYLEIADYIDSSLWCEEGKLVEFFIFKELVGNLDDALLAVLLAGKVDTDGDLVLDSFETKDSEGLIYIFSRNMVQYGTVFQCADY